MKRNKFLLKLLAFTCAIALIAGSSIAYFTDRANLAAAGTAGSFDIEVYSELSGKSIMIPNKGYELSTSISNFGNKSADIKMVITLESDDVALLEGNPAIADIYYLSENGDKVYLSGEGSVNGYSYSKTMNEDDTVTFVLKTIINGNEEFAERETETGVDTDTFMPELFLGIEDYSSTSATYVTIKVDIYAKQHRNTGSNWDLLTTYQEVQN